MVHTGLEARRIVGEQFVSGIVVKNGGGTESTLPVEGVFMLLTGTAPVTDFIGGAVRTHAEGCIDADCHAATNVPGVYAVGDVTCMHPNQAIIAAAEGVIAALSIDKFLPVESGRKWITCSVRLKYPTAVSEGVKYSRFGAVRMLPSFGLGRQTQQDAFAVAPRSLNRPLP